MQSTEGMRPPSRISSSIGVVGELPRATPLGPRFAPAANGLPQRRTLGDSLARYSGWWGRSSDEGVPVPEANCRGIPTWDGPSVEMTKNG